ncbi:hypothetical protein [Aureibacter tunicatorum]|uniref:Secreted protein n=1 Tax=Aureibacter tunicatorum TaxID=866807 RepID=A0AAE3XR20_9BACT|nr:hypothetical protein [Aureibacter tunicatorum]MDR6241100.1 hypothetical protein [Aureibacter tunicatorum]BDD03878.1 hypothetical protein AUTU_13610 [Aureibacter tunicatorum]
MKIASLIILFAINLTGLYAQSNEFLDSLSTDTSNLIIVFDDNCTGCIVVNSPCEEYPNSGNPKNKYIIWKNDNGFHIKRFNICGNSNTITIKKWKNNLFDFIKVNSIKLDTTKIQYPLLLDRRDSTWFEMKTNHYKYYNFSFLSNEIQEISVRDYAFREPKDDDEIWYEIDIEFRKNRDRYKFNNTSAIKELLDISQKIIRKNKKKLEITNANN